MRRLSAPSCLLLAVVVLATLPACSLGRRGTGASPGSFGVGCAWSHSAADDPIVSPRRPGASHLHAFFGNTTTDAWSTRRSLLRGSTTCTDPADTAAVWAPVALLGSGIVEPLRERTYYFRRIQVVETVPADLRAIAGNPAAASADENPAVEWNCGKGTPSADHPYDCRPFAGSGNVHDGVIARVDFPWCWDGRTDAPDHRSHLAYPDGRRCPDTHPRAIPQISVRVHYGVMDPCAGAVPCGPEDEAGNVQLSLASGGYETFHADFWNTWQQDRLDELVERCLGAGVACGLISSDG